MTIYHEVRQFASKSLSALSDYGHRANRFQAADDHLRIRLESGSVAPQLERTSPPTQEV
jgi:hypothetical protein